MYVGIRYERVIVLEIACMVGYLGSVFCDFCLYVRPVTCADCGFCLYVRPVTGAHCDFCLYVRPVTGAHCDVCFVYKGNNKITELRTILQRESQNS